jgi:hypothetical protein
MAKHRLFFISLIAFMLVSMAHVQTRIQSPGPDLIVGRNVNMVAGQEIDTGDPYLQRQNEPSITVNARNHWHLFAVCNDYRLVDYPESEGPLPGIPEQSAAGDAWLGIFKSYDGGLSWRNMLLPGHPFDDTTEGMNSPLYGYEAASDGTARAGPSGLVFVSGIVFDRIKNGKSAIFVARYMDYNTQAIGDIDSSKHLDSTLVDQKKSGQFADKPWLAVDIPRYGNETVPISAPSASGQLSALNSSTQYIPRYNVYVVYSVFYGSDTSHDHSEIMFVRSTDCGNSWERPVKLSESVHVCQGTCIAVSPKDGTIYIVWRQYAREEQGVPDAIVTCKSDDFGQTFTKATEIDPIDPFDQYTGGDRFRTATFPALAVDYNGVVYEADSEREIGPNGEARIVIRTSKNGIDWSDPTAVDNHAGGGHQIDPSMIFSGGELKIAWYDTRKSLGNVDQNGTYHYHPDIADPGPTGLRHTLDTWVARADPSNPSSNPPSNPVFTDSTQVSRYIYEAMTDANGDLVDGDGIPVDISGNPPVIYQAQHNFSNLPIFIGGTAPFIGDYLDITPASMFLYDHEEGTWRFNTGEKPFDPTLSAVSFVCNRDVMIPTPPANWMSYRPPGPGCLDDMTAGSRNQNIYTAQITNGIFAGSPVNTKPLEQFPASFLVYVKNLTDADKLIRLTIDAPGDMDASFWEEEPPSPEECPLGLCEERVVELPVLAHSSITLTLFVQPYYNPLASFRVIIEELNGAGGLTGLKNSVEFNPDPVCTQLIPPLEEYHTPVIISEEPSLVNLSDPTMLSGQVVYVSPYLEELLNFCNPDIVAPGVRHPGVRHDSIINPGVRHTAIGSIPNGEVTDLQWKVTNDGNTTSAYSFETIGETPSVPHQLLIYRVTSTPDSEDCILSEEEHHELLLSIENPGVRHPGVRHEGIDSPGVRHNTFFLAPGEEAIVTLRLIDPKNPHPFDPEFYAKTVAGAAIPQAENPDGDIYTANFMWIYTTDLPDGSINDPYPETMLEAEGGEEPYSWSLIEGYGDLPPGLALDSDGTIWGSPIYDPNVTYPNTYNFAVQATDSNGQIAYRSLSIPVYCELYTITAAAGEKDENGVFIPYVNGAGPGGTISPCCSETVPQGGTVTFTITADNCYDWDVVMDGQPQGPVDTYTFEDVRGDSTIEAIFKQKTYIITASAGENGTISPPGAVTIGCGESQTYMISPDSCFTVADVLVDGGSVGAVTSYTFNDVRDNHTIEASFVPLVYKITSSAGEGGSIDPEGEVTVICGESQTFTITTDVGYQLADVLVDGHPADNIVKGSVTTYTFYNVQADHDIEAVFIKLEAWVKRYNNDSVNGDDEANDIAVDLSGNSYVTGASLGDPTGPDIYTISYDGNGNVRYSDRHDGPAHEGDFGNAVAVDADKNACITGRSFRGMPHKHSDIETVTYDSAGDLEWEVRYDARRNGNDEAVAIAVDNSGYVYITGRSEDSLDKQSDVLHNDFYTLKYDIKNRGREVWGARYNNDSVDGDDEATAIAVDAAGNVYVTGFSDNGSNNDIVTIKYDPDGNPVWSDEIRRYDGGYNDEASGIGVDAEGNVYVTGRSQGSGTGYDCITIKYDSTGNQLWALKYNNASENGNDEAVAIAVDAAGNVSITGKSQGSDTGYDYITIQYDSSGTDVWEARFDGGNGADEAMDIAIDGAGDVYVTGRSQGSGTGLDYLTIKYDHSGNMIWRVRYDNAPPNGDDEAAALAIDPAGNVYVTGRSQGSGSGFDYATVKYQQQLEQEIP